MTASGSRFIQWSAALENTASNSASKFNESPSATWAFRPRAFAAATMSGRSIHADDFGADSDQFLSKRAVTAAEIENALSGPRVQEIKHGLAKVGNKAGVLGVAGRVPLLGRRLLVHVSMVKQPHSSADAIKNDSFPWRAAR